MNTKLLVNYWINSNSQSDFSKGQEARAITCGERVRGEYSIGGSADSDGNKSVDAEVKVESNDEKTSATAKVEANQDKDGKSTVQFEGKVTKSF